MWDKQTKRYVFLIPSSFISLNFIERSVGWMQTMLFTVFSGVFFSFVFLLWCFGCKLKKTWQSPFEPSLSSSQLHLDVIVIVAVFFAKRNQPLLPLPNDYILIISWTSLSSWFDHWLWRKILSLNSRKTSRLRLQNEWKANETKSCKETS